MVTRMILKFSKVIILILTVNIHKKIDFSKNTLIFLATSCEKSGCGRPHPDMMF